MISYIFEKLFNKQTIKFLFLFILILSISIFFLFLNSYGITHTPSDLLNLYIVQFLFSFFLTFSVTGSTFVIEYLKENYIDNKLLYYVISFFLIMLSIVLGNLLGSIYPSFLYNKSILYTFKSSFLNTLAISIVLSIVLPIYTGRKMELEIKKKREKELLKLTEETKYELLLSKISSHFLFNTLTTISAYIDINSEKSKDMIEKLSNILRYSLQFDINVKIPLEDELKIVNDYIFIEKYRFGTKLDWKIDIEEGLKNVRIPELTIQPLVENSIKYNISKSVNGGIIEIKVYTDNNRVNIKVSDSTFDNNGKDIQRNITPIQHGFGIGLKNIAERLKIAYINNASIENKKIENGFEVLINIPQEYY